ncbi:hypothetical protein M0R45_034036 [Rubus argutus]|uniref:NAC domain-containing protein n=1 Tax=Rubus argutus TaxID=59490 RepID=A0AAW1VSM7_RUBAR
MSSSRITIPEGFRFHPSEEELLRDYLETQNQGTDSQINDIIPVIDVCNHEPRHLPALVFTRAEFLHNECYYSYTQWYFFSPLHYKYSNSTRSNRTTEQGYWKITGKDRAIRARGSKAEIGRKRTLTFYLRCGETKPKKTDWVIHEYYHTAKGNQIGDFVLCCLKNKSDKFDHDKDAPFFDGGEPGSGSSSMASNVEYQITEAQENLASKDDEAEPCSGSNHIIASDFEIQSTSNGMNTEAEEFQADKELREAVQIPNDNEDAFNNSLQTAGSRRIDKNELSNSVEGHPDSCNPSDSDMSDESLAKPENLISHFPQPQPPQTHQLPQQHPPKDYCSSALQSPISTELENASHGTNVSLVSNTESNSDNQAANEIPEGNSPPGANLELVFHPFQQQDFDFSLPPINGGPRYFSHINNSIGWDEVIFSPRDINSSLAYFSTIIGGGSGVGSDSNTEVVPESVNGYSALAIPP